MPGSTPLESQNATLEHSRYGYTTADFRAAVSGNGPRAGDWSDKPHRLIYDLCSWIEELQEQARNSVKPRQKWCSAMSLRSDFDAASERHEKALVRYREAETELARARAVLNTAERESWSLFYKLFNNNDLARNSREAGTKPNAADETLGTTVINA